MTVERFVPVAMIDGNDQAKTAPALGVAHHTVSRGVHCTAPPGSDILPIMEPALPVEGIPAPAEAVRKVTTFHRSAGRGGFDFGYVILEGFI